MKRLLGLPLRAGDATVTEISGVPAYNPNEAMTDQQQPPQAGATAKPPSYQNTSGEIYPLPFFVTRGESSTTEPSEQTELIQQADTSEQKPE